MQSVVQDRRTGGADVGASVCRQGQETPRQSGGNSTPVGTAASWAPCASLPVSPSRVHLRCAEQPSRTSEPPGGPSSRARISSTPVTTSGPRRHAVHQPEAQAAAQRPAAAVPSESGRNRRSAATSRETFDASAETRNTRGIFVVRIVRSLVEGLRRCVPRYSARRCQGIPLPRALADVRHFLDALYYEEVCFLILRSCLTIVHTGVFLYSCVWEKPFKTHVTVALVLGILSVLTLVRVLCQYQIVKALARLRWAWWQRTILPDFARLLRSPLWQCQRILFLVSFSFYFVALHLAYYRGIATNVETSNAPVLVRYVSVVVLVFLSVLGPHILMLVIVCASLFVCWCASAADIEQLLVEEPRGAGRALPARLLQMMHEEQWTPPERDHRRSSDSNRNSTTSSSSRRGSDATPDLDKQAPGQQSKRGTHLLTQITGLSDADQQYSETRKHRCGKKTEENRSTDDGNEVKYGSEFICAICLTEFREGDVVRRLPCSHVFHSACITRWLSSHASCPLRCYVNFFIGHINRPSYEASRCFRMLASQLLRRPRSRFLASLRQRHQRHVGQQRPTPQVQPQQTQQREGEQGHQEGQEHQQQLAEEEREEPQGDLRDRAEFLEVSPCVGCGAADARAISAVAETQTLAEELSERAVSSCAGDEGKEDVFREKQEGEERMPMNKAPRHSLEGSREGVGEIGAEQVPSEGGGNFVMHRCCVDDTRIQEEDNGMYYVSLRNADASRREEGGNVGAAEVTLTGNMPQRTSAVQVTRKALEGSFLRASMESTVALSVRSRDGSSELSPSHSDNRIFSQESDMWT